jgi:hypothetical protein
LKRIRVGFATTGEDMSENKRLLSFLQSKKMNDYLFMDARTTKRGRIVFDLTGNVPQDLYVQTYGLERCLPDKEPVGEMKALFSFHYVISGVAQLLIMK